MTRTIILLVITYLLNVVDYFQTTYAVSEFGLDVEANPIARYLLTTDHATLIKLLLPAILLMLLGIIVRVDKRCAWFAYAAFTLNLVVVINNFIVLFKLGVIERLNTEILSTLVVVMGVVLVVLSAGVGALLAYCKHLRKKNKE